MSGTLSLAPLVLFVIVAGMWAADRTLRALELRSLRLVPVATARQSHPLLEQRGSTIPPANQARLRVDMPTATCAPRLATGMSEGATIRRDTPVRKRDAA